MRRCNGKQKSTGGLYLFYGIAVNWAPVIKARLYMIAKGAVDVRIGCALI